eukprot:NODE_3715_length_528_cov_92.294363_g3155_i0.p1 GENE.NODE_3715_length_528_cov_92.294363_g3155_i0~~NODE_3715_length_528_cov_92.294363_g3155_i0.p1  ORF type:complete len:134 (+),score=22.33 NODE_3715_length_528_cov_92.294363_g3155_i0:28-429(+)
MGEGSDWEWRSVSEHPGDAANAGVVYPDSEPPNCSASQPPKYTLIHGDRTAPSHKQTNNQSHTAFAPSTNSVPSVRFPTPPGPHSFHSSGSPHGFGTPTSSNLAPSHNDFQLSMNPDSAGGHRPTFAPVPQLA